MKKKITKELTLFFTKNYPLKIKNNNQSKKKYTVTIGIGGNIGNSKMVFNKLFLKLQNNKNIDLIETSPILKNPPFGYLNQNYFYNAIIQLKTDYKSKTFFHYIMRLEKRFKRVRSFKDAPRTLDIDIIFFNNEKINNSYLTVPHIDYKNRDSVLIPLKFITTLKI